MIPSSRESGLGTRSRKWFYLIELKSKMHFTDHKKLKGERLEKESMALLIAVVKRC